MMIFSLLPGLLRSTFQDILGIRHNVSPNIIHANEAIDWLCRAQDVSGDGGVSAWYSLLFGWQPSYIETTGYIINTFLDASRILRRPELRKRAIRMADFLVSMQLESGGYRTAVPQRQQNSEPTVFNSGQDLIGLCAVYKQTKKKKYLQSVVRAADFLLSIQESDGSWLKYTYGSMKQSYATRVAWGLLLVWECTGEKKYKRAAIKNLEWASKNQRKNGWFSLTHLPHPNPKDPYTHTISYTIEGFLWSGILLGNKKYVRIAQNAASVLARVYLRSKFLPATFDENWKSHDTYTCLTGDAQLALVWIELYKQNKDPDLLNAAKKMIVFLKTMQPTGYGIPQDIRGAIKGSNPIFGDIFAVSGYCRMTYLNWSTKFFIDALFAENSL